MADGWKYFDLMNLNELFAIKFGEWKKEKQDNGDSGADNLPHESEMRIQS